MCQNSNFYLIITPILFLKFWNSSSPTSNFFKKTQKLKATEEVKGNKNEEYEFYLNAFCVLKKSNYK